MSLSDHAEVPVPTRVTIISLKVLQRNQSIEVICRETESLANTSASFKDGSRSLKRKIIWDNIKVPIAA